MDIDGRRNRLLDVVRGAGIVLVVFAHAIQTCNGRDDPLRMFIGAFQMPLLMAVSGYAMGMSRPRRFVESLSRKVDRLLVPYVAWTFVHSFFECLKNGCWGYMVTGLATTQFWFLRILFWIVMGALIAEGVYHRLKLSRCLQFCLAASIYFIMMYAITLIPSQESTFGLSVYFAGGYVLAKWINPILRYEKSILAVCSLFGLMFCLDMGRLHVLDHRISAVFGICLVVCISAFFSRRFNSLSETIARIGKNTLPIYAIHWCLFFAPHRIAWEKVPTPPFQGGGYVMPLIVMCMWLVGVWLLMRLLSRSNYLSRAFLGARHRCGQ